MDATAFLQKRGWTMARPKKNGKYLNVCIQEEIYKKLEDFCLEAGQTKTIAVERALAQYIENYGAMQEKLNKIDSTAMWEELPKYAREKIL